MIRHILASAFLISSAFAAAPGVDNAIRPDGNPHTFTFGGENGESFLLDGDPFQFRGGEIHFQRVPREHWRHVIRLAKSMGLNTIASYIFWNDIEQPDGSFDFKTGRRDLAAFLTICQEEGMWFQLRPGPYVCGEWDFGGIPPYLLKYPDLKIRTTEDERWMKAQTRYLDAVAEVAEPFLVKNGGPIILTQIENEYGSYARKDYAYLEWLKDYWTKKGFGPFNMADGPADHFLKGNTLPGVAVGLDEGNNDSHWEAARRNNPGVPIFSAETYPGWLRHWGEGNWRPTDKVAVVDWYMKNGKSFNIFVLQGGTNYGFTAGANGDDNGYEPDLTSYDYGSPISEQSTPSHNYHAYRDTISSYLPEDQQPPALDPDLEFMEIPAFTPEKIGTLSDNLPKAMKQEVPQYFESWGQNQGLAIYTTALSAGPEAELTFEKLSDYAMIFLDGKRIATHDRREGSPKPITIAKREKSTRLSVIVEGMGHINYGIQMEADRKGIVGEVKLGDTTLRNWSVFSIPLDDASVTGFEAGNSEFTGPGSRFRASFEIKDEPLATFIDMSKHSKGVVWVNGHNLGRYWNIGPQQSLYCPASFLKKGTNIIDIVDLEMDAPQQIRSLKEPVYSGKVDTKNLDNIW